MRVILTADHRRGGQLKRSSVLFGDCHIVSSSVSIAASVV
jgi:hypothetical protein